jgi:hypothetical protein
MIVVQDPVSQPTFSNSALLIRVEQHRNPQPIYQEPFFHNDSTADFTTTSGETDHLGISHGLRLDCGWDPQDGNIDWCSTNHSATQ